MPHIPTMVACMGPCYQSRFASILRSVSVSTVSSNLDISMPNTFADFLCTMQTLVDPCLVVEVCEVLALFTCIIC
jgi:hypothetical protein